MEFKPGDLVQLKSGGPVMTVESVGKHNVTQEETVFCVWNETVGKRQEVRREHFSPVTLKKYERPSGTIQVGRM